MGKTKYFVSLSLILLAIGWISVFRQGLQYGIDFKGGTLVDVAFAGTPPLAQVRAALPGVSVKPISDQLDPASKNDIEIGLEQKEDQTLDAGRTQVLDVLEKMYGNEQAGKKDFNNQVDTASLAAYLTQKDPLNLGTAAGNRYHDLAADLLAARNPHRGILTSFDELRSVPGVNSAVLSDLSSQYSLGSFAIRDAQSVGATVGSQLRHQAVYATLYALAGMLIYVAFRFELVYGAAAVIAVFHDVLITLGLFSLFHYEISLTVIAALLTLVGYSMNDTIVIFDRVREDVRLMRREPFADIVNKAINQTLSRTILTSGLTLLTVLVLYLLGGAALRAFSFAMVVGVVVGTYSSFGIAAPIVVAWNKFHGTGTAVRAGSAADKRVVAAARR